MAVSTSSPIRVACVILAAGGSRRLGRSKQLVPIQGRTLIECAVAAALESHCTETIVVLGAHRAEIEPLLEDLPVTITGNPAWEEGMASSIRAGVGAAEKIAPPIDALILTPCDLPGLSSVIIDQLIGAHHETAHPIAASTYGGVLGTPALFHRSLFPDLLALTGDTGARKLIRSDAGRCMAVDFREGERDIDTEADVVFCPSLRTQDKQKND